MEELIIWFFNRIAFLRNTEPRERTDDGRPKILPPIDDDEPIEERERALMELTETLNDPSQRETLSEQYAARSNALTLATWKLNEIEKVINDSDADDGEAWERIGKILKTELDELPAMVG